MLLKAVNCLILCALLLLLGAAPPVPAGSNTEITQHPEVLIADANPASISLYGIHVGDKVDLVPQDKVERAGSRWGYYGMKDNYGIRYNQNTRIVTALVILNRDAVQKAGFIDRYDVEFRFGVADYHDDHHLTFLKRHLLVTVDNNQVLAVEIR